MMLCATVAEARPYRAMVTRTASTTPEGNVELGLRYQSLWLDVPPWADSPNIPFHQLALHTRYGVFDALELELQLELLLSRISHDTVAAYLGDIPLAMQLTFVDGRNVALGLYGRVTVPTGPDGIDALLPTLSDGTWDGEATLVAEARFSRDVRLMMNFGYLRHGTRERGGRPDYDVPDALRYDLALTVNATRWFLLGIELSGRSFLRRDITPVWTNHQHLVEAIPGIRIETVPKLVLEAAVAIALTEQLRDMYVIRPSLGLTYEF